MEEKEESKAEKHRKHSSSSMHKTMNVEKALIENFASMQKVLTNLAIKFDNLSEQISKLLELFEITAKAMAEKDFEALQSNDNRQLTEKINDVLEQNKTIAKTLTLMNEASFDSEYKKEINTGNMAGYQPSISTSSSKFKPLPKY
ncbi:MAG: hypothetical protein AABX30_00095 [Nanoarchaeota archaeon]